MLHVTFHCCNRQTAQHRRGLIKLLNYSKCIASSNVRAQDSGRLHSWGCFLALTAWGTSFYHKENNCNTDWLRKRWLLELSQKETAEDRSKGYICQWANERQARDENEYQPYSTGSCQLAWSILSYLRNFKKKIRGKHTRCSQLFSITSHFEMSATFYYF